MEELEGWPWKAGRTDAVWGPGRHQCPEEGQAGGQEAGITPSGFLAST